MRYQPSSVRLRSVGQQWRVRGPPLSRPAMSLGYRPSFQARTGGSYNSASFRRFPARVRARRSGGIHAALLVSELTAIQNTRNTCPWFGGVAVILDQLGLVTARTSNVPRDCGLERGRASQNCSIRLRSANPPSHPAEYTTEPYQTNYGRSAKRSVLAVRQCQSPHSRPQLPRSRFRVRYID